ncbi:MAG: hypothetical protein ACOX6T_18825 [Myxococcales bacterium]|jgi:hypothetical protein
MSLRPSKSVFSRCVAMVSFLFVAACHPRADVVLTHPLATGTVSTNRAVRTTAIGKDDKSLPASAFDQTGSLTSLDADNACFMVVTRLLENVPVDPASLNARLQVGEAELTALGSMQGEPRFLEVDGTEVRPIQDGESLTCTAKDSSTGLCTRWVRQAHFVEGEVPATFLIVERPVQFCFDTKGVITESTDALTLNVQLGRSRLTTMRWALQAPAAK